MEPQALPAWLEERVPSVAELRSRLQLLIPEQLDPEGFARREMAARTVFVMLYGFAVEGQGRWIRPTAVTDMTDDQAAKTGDKERRSWLERVQSSLRPRNVRGRWYSENTREPIRDETLRKLIELGIVVERPGLATTSPLPRYALATDFLPLCDPELAGERLTAATEAWRAANLSSAVLARLALLRKGVPGDGGILVALPNGETRRLAPGPSARLAKAAVEVLAPRLLVRPAVVLISESAQKIGYRDEEILRLVRLDIDAVSTLPDLVLVDVGVNPPLLVFVECVATAGAVTERRRSELEAIARQAGYQETDCALVTVFHDRVDSPFKAAATTLAWGSFVWFETEPDHLLFLRDGRELPTITLATLLRATQT